jgi:hypothetical protein
MALRRHDTKLPLVVALASLLVVAGCELLGVSRADRLRRDAHSLLPRSATTLRESTEDCVQLAPSPSCAVVYFEIDGEPFAARRRLVLERARAQGWNLARVSSGPGGVQLFFEREGSNGSVHLVADAVLEHCGRRIRLCRESVLVRRG